MSINIEKQKFLVQNGSKAEVEYSNCKPKEEKIEWRIIGPVSAELGGYSIELGPNEGDYNLELLYDGEKADEVNFTSHQCEGMIEKPEVKDSAEIDSVGGGDEYDAQTTSILKCDPILATSVDVTVGFSNDVEWRLSGTGVTHDFITLVEVEVGVSSVFHSVAGNDVKDEVIKFRGAGQPTMPGGFSFSETKDRTLIADQERSTRSYGKVWSKYTRKIWPFWGSASARVETKGFELETFQAHKVSE